MTTSTDHSDIQISLSSFEALFGHLSRAPLAHAETTNSTNQPENVSIIGLTSDQKGIVDELGLSLNRIARKIDQLEKAALFESDKRSRLQSYLSHEVLRNKKLEGEILHLRKRKFDEENQDLPSTAMISDTEVAKIERFTKAVDEVQDKLANGINFTIDELKQKYITRIFDGVPFVGVTVKWEKPYFLVVYEDGDPQRLSLGEVRVSLLADDKVDPKKAAMCLRHVRAKTYEQRELLPSVYTRSTKELIS